MTPDLNKPTGPPPDKNQERLREVEAKLFSSLHDGAEAANGTFRLGHYPLVQGKSDQWPYWLLHNRDCSQVMKRIAATLTRIDETVIDCAECTVLSGAGKTTAIHRTATAHAIMDGEPRMLAVERRDETATLHADSLGPVVLNEYLQRAKDSGLDVAAAPLYGLERELVTEGVRRSLLKLGISYALLLNPFHPFLKVFSSPRDSWDIEDWIQAEDLFDVYKADRDRSEPDFLVVGDLTVGDEEARRPVAEFVVEIPNGDTPIHFLTLPALPPPAKKHEQKERSARAIEMAQRAAELLSASPAAELRAHEFHHRDVAVYRKVLEIVQWGRLV